MRIKKVTTKAKKIRKLFAVIMAFVCTLAGVNIASAETNINNIDTLQAFIGSSGEGTVGNIIDLIDATIGVGNVLRNGLTINGNSYILDGHNSGMGFTIGNSITSFTINNIKMEKFTGVDGGAIHNIAIADTAGDNVVVRTDSISGGFAHNVATGSGGAIDNFQTAVSGATANATIGNISGNFFDNSATKYGGAISNVGTIESIDANAMDNTAQIGGFIANAGIINSISGNFINNTASGKSYGDGGGAVANFLYDNTAGTTVAKITSVTGNFINNNAYIGGAIKNSANAITSGISLKSEIGTISGNFRGNTADLFGGAIANSYTAESGTSASVKIGTIKGTFIENTTGYYGGAICNTGTIDSIDADFTENSASAQGGAIWNNGTINSVKGKFTSNKATGDDATVSGGAIYNNTDAKISFEDTTFLNNFTTNQGGAIYNKGTLSLNGNNIFENNSATAVSSVYGGAILNEGMITVLNADFAGNKATTSSGQSCGGAIFNDTNGKIGDITGNFTNNSANSDYEAQGGAILNNTQAEIGDIEGDFKYNSVSGGRVRGGAIVNINGAKIGDITGSFEYNEAKSTDTYSDGGGAIANISYGEIGDITGNFKNNKATAYTFAKGGAIYNYDHTSIGDIKGDFTDNSITSTNDTAYGGAIYNYVNAQIGNITGSFKNNSAKGDAFVYGGAVYNSFTASLGNITGDFISNSAISQTSVAQGGAIFNNGASEIGNITGDFKYNSAVSNSVALNNNIAQGGAIYNDHSEIGNINGDFVGNKAEAASGTAQGGAIYNIGTINSINGTYTDNKVSGQTANGGAIYNGSAMVLKTSNLNKNSAKNGGGLYLGSNSISNLSTTRFIENSATNGGAIFTQNVEDDATNNANARLNINDATFTGNTVTENGGAIYNTLYGSINPNDQTVLDTVLVTKSDFYGNSAKYGGAVYNAAQDEADGIHDAVITFVDTTFTENTATKGGAIYNAGTLDISAVNKNLVFEDNKAEIGSDIYNIGALGLSATEHRTITFNGSIEAEENKQGSIDILGGSDSKGTIIFNGLINNQNITLNSGNETLGLGREGSFKGIDTLTLKGGHFDISNGVANTIIADQVIGTDNGDAKLSFDWSDSLEHTNINPMTTKISMGSVIVDPLNLDDSSNFNTIDFGDSKAYTYGSSVEYVVSQLANGNLHIDDDNPIGEGNGLTAAIAQTSTSAATFMADGTFTQANDTILGSVKNDLTIVGTSTDSANVIETTADFVHSAQGMTVENGVTVTVKNTSIKNFKAANLDGGFAYNKGTMNINGYDSKYDVALQNNRARNGGAIYNSSEHTLTNTSITYLSNIAKQEPDVGGTYVGGNGGAVANVATTENAVTLDSIVQYQVNEAEGDGGAIYNYANVYASGTPITYTELIANYTGTDVQFKNNTAEGNGGAIYSDAATYTDTSVDPNVTYTSTATVVLTNAKFSYNKATLNGGAIYNGVNSALTFTQDGDYEFVNNEAALGGAIYNASTTVLDICDATFEGNSATKGGAVYNASIAEVSFTDSNIADNTATEQGGAVYTEGNMVSFISNMQDTIVAYNIANGKKQAVYFNGTGANQLNLLALQSDKLVAFDGAVVSNGTSTTVSINEQDSVNNIYPKGTVILGENFAVYDASGHDLATTYKINGGTLTLANESSLTGGGNNTLSIKNATLNTINNKTRGLLLDTLTTNKANWQFDVTNAGNDQLYIINSASGSLNITDINTSELANGITEYKLLANGSKDVLFTIDPLLQNRILQDKILRRSVSVSGNTLIMNPSQGWNSYDSFNPAVLAGAVSQQGAFLTQINTYDQAFTGMDIMMNLTREQRMAYKYANKYAGVNNGVMTFSPNQVPEENTGIWFRPFVSFEKVNMPHGPNTENNMYGMIFGGDSGLIELSHGWNMTWGAYAGYTGSHQNYDGVSIYQNGGSLGLNAAWYKGNFFTGLTANVGASVAEASTMYGNENMTMLMTGIASKTGYNWEVFNSKLIVQPSFLISYSFVNTFNYTNAAGVSMSSSPLNAIQIAPGIKFIGNLPHGWQPYLNVQMVWNIMDQAKFYANDVHLPQMSVDPYIQYGVGLQKRWGDRFTGFGQVMLRNGGRNGVALNVGFRWAIGKEASNTNKNLKSSVPIK